MFGFLLIRGDGQPNDSPALVTAGSELDRRRDVLNRPQARVAHPRDRHEHRRGARRPGINIDPVPDITSRTVRAAIEAAPVRTAHLPGHGRDHTRAPRGRRRLPPRPPRRRRPDDDRRDADGLVRQPGDAVPAAADGESTSAGASVRACECDRGRLLRLLPRANRSRPERDRAPPGPRVPLPDSEWHASAALVGEGEGEARLSHLSRQSRFERDSGTSCAIVVSYKSGPSSAAGLYAQRARAGRISWTLKVGTRTTSGRWPIDIVCGAAGSLHTSFVVT